MRGIQARLARLEHDAGKRREIENLSGDQLNARIRELCETIAEHPESTPEDKALAKSELAKLDAEERESHE